MPYENIVYTVEDRIARITLNRPEKRNALSWPLLDELSGALKAAERTFEEAKKHLADVSNRVRDKAFTAVKEAAAGQSVHMHIFLAARDQKEKEMWGREGGSKAYRDRMVAERAVMMLKGILNGTIDPTPAPRPKEEAKPDQTPAETPMVQSAGN